MGKFGVKIISFLSQFLILFVFPLTCLSQSSSEKKKIFTQAETYFLYEDYELANQLYLLLEKPGNLNIKYKIGTCYLNIPGEKEKSIAYLEEAVKNADYDSKTSSPKELRAPLDAYFSLAKAYMVNNDLDKGLNTLETFKKLTSDKMKEGGMKNSGFIDQQIQACANAIKLKAKPVIFSKRLMGKDFSQGAINDNPTISYDGNTFVYTERRGIVNAILCARREKGIWQTPVDITSELKAGEDCSSCSLNSDGTELFLYKIDNFDGVIYSSSYEKGSWTPVKKLNKNINTKFYESHASVSSDGKKLYFASNREGGLGNLDIYLSEKDATGDWGPAINLGNTINTPFNEDNPFVTNNDSLLYFSSEGHSSIGGFDIFISKKSGDSWDLPSNIGYPLNTTDDDKFFQPWNDGQNGFYSITTDYKKREIFYLGFGGIDVNKSNEITGILSLADTIIPFNENFKIHIIERTSGDTIDISYPNNKTGLYRLFVPSGQYHLVYTGPGYISQTIDTSIVRDNPTNALNIDVTLKRDLLVNSISPEVIYSKINLKSIPSITNLDTTILIRNMRVTDLGDKNIKDSEILYFTVQVMALYKPVDVSYFKYIPDIKVMYNEHDKFFRYTTGIFQTREEAYAWRLELIKKGYPDDLFLKKVSKQ